MERKEGRKGGRKQSFILSLTRDDGFPPLLVVCMDRWLRLTRSFTYLLGSCVYLKIRNAGVLVEMSEVMERDTVVGVCWCTDSCQASRSHGWMDGWIFMLIETDMFD